MSKELVTMDSLAEAKKMVAILRRHSDDDVLRATFVNSTTASAWPFLVEAKYLEWIVEKAGTWKENEILANGLPGWCQTASEVAAAIKATNQITQMGRSQDLKPLRVLRSLALRKLLKPMLSGGPGIAVPAHPPKKDGQSSSHEIACVKAASSLMFTMAMSFTHHPDHFTLEYVSPFLINSSEQNILLKEPNTKKLSRFCESGAVEIAARCWWYYPEDLVARCESTMGISNMILLRNCDKNVLDTLMRTIPANEVVKRCKKVLQSWLPPNNIGIAEKFNQCSELQLIHALCTPQIQQDSTGIVLGRGVYHELGLALLNAGVHRLVLDVATRAIDDDAQKWLKMHSIAGVLVSLFGAVPDPVVTLTPYIDPGGMLGLISRLFTDGSFHDNKDAWFEILEAIEFNACGERAGSRTPRAEAYADAIRKALKRNDLYDRTLVRLEAMTRVETNKSTKEIRAKRLKAWYDLGKDVELVGRESLLNPPMHHDRKDRSNEENRHVCWWSECARRVGDKTTEKELLRCAGCKKARYCSRECQTKDWKEQHKATCKSMKGA